MCPNGVAITDLISMARAEMVAAQGGVSLRQRLLNRPDSVGRVLGLVPGIANTVLGNRTLRALAHATVGIHRNAPLPHIAGPRFRRWLAAHPQPDGPVLAYFSGCAVEHYDPEPGISTIRILNHLGFRVEAPSAACCSLPMLSSGEWDAARPRAEALVLELATSTETQTPVVSTSTSCSLALRSKYAANLGMVDATASRVARAVVDICEFIRGGHTEQIAPELGPVGARVVYHAPCQLRNHGMGQPALELLRLVPGLSVEPSGGLLRYRRHLWLRSRSASDRGQGRPPAHQSDRRGEARPRGLRQRDLPLAHRASDRSRLRSSGEILDASLHGTDLPIPRQR